MGCEGWAQHAPATLARKAGTGCNAGKKNGCGLTLSQSAPVNARVTGFQGLKGSSRLQGVQP